MEIRKVDVPKDVQVEISGRKIIVKGPLGTLEKEFNLYNIDWRVEGSTVIISSLSKRRKDIAMVGTIAAHIKNMILGVTKGFRYRLKVLYSHFPIQVKVQEKNVLIYNFLGEKTYRTAKIVGNCNVTIKGNEIIVEGIDKYEVGQTAANIEQATKIKDRDPRVFQDGIYLVSRE